MKTFIEAGELPESEKVYLKKDFTGWRVVEPLSLEGKIIWKNVFNIKGFVVLAYILLLLLIIYLTYHEQIGNYERVIKNPCSFCTTCQSYCSGLIKNISFDKDWSIDIKEADDK